MSKGKFLAVCLIWLTIFGIGAITWRLVVTPMRQAATAHEEEQRKLAEEEAKQEAIAKTRGDLPYQHEVTIALDSFSGYAVLRSKEFAQRLRSKKIKLNLLGRRRKLHPATQESTRVATSRWPRLPSML